MKLTRDLVVLDLESTGVWIEKDKIIEIAMVRYRPIGNKEIFHTRINPGMPIPPIVTELTGISDEAVKNAPAFRAAAADILAFLGTADLGGFNVERFDLPLLEREFLEAGMKFEWQSRKIYDAQVIYHLNEKRDLTAAYQFYCGKKLTGAHSALADTEAAFEILERQVSAYGGGEESIQVLDQFEYKSHADNYDSEGKFCWWNGKLYPTFGKYRRKTSLNELAQKDTEYLAWILKSDFKTDVKDLVQAALKGKFPTKT